MRCTIRVAGLGARPRPAAAILAASLLLGSPLPAIAQVRAWGRNQYGQLGDGTLGNASTPVTVNGLANVIAVAAGEEHSLALKSDGTVWAWGRGGYGQLGNGSSANSVLPVQVTGLTGVTAISARGWHSLALKGDGTVWAWGLNTSGRLGDGTTILRNAPVRILIPASEKAAGVAAGRTFSLAWTAGGAAYAWGYNANGQLGLGSTTEQHSPQRITALTGVIGLSGGTGHALALVSGGSVWAWGANNVSQVGDGTTLTRLSPVPVPSLAGVTAVAAGADHNLALLSDGSVMAWGYGVYGAMGDGTGHSNTTPQPVPGLAGVREIAAGQNYAVVRRSDGTLRAWGYNAYGQLGNGTTTNSNVPVPVSGIDAAIAIGAGYTHALAASGVPTAPIVCVKPTGSDANDGSTWALAKRTIQAGIASATAEVWVAAGTYDESVAVSNSVALYGGFKGTETVASQRNSTLNVTTLGAISVDVLEDSVIIDGVTVRAGGITMNGSRTVTIANCIVHGSIRGGREQLDVAVIGTQVIGGGIEMTLAFTLDVQDCIISGSPGLGIDASGTAVTSILRNSITNCANGGIWVNTIGIPIVAGNTVADNGGVGIVSTDVNGVTIHDNLVLRNRGGIEDNSQNNSRVYNNTIVANTAPGGGIKLGGHFTPTYLANNVVAGNSSGILASRYGEIVLSHNDVYGNADYDYSGLPEPTGTNGNIKVDPLFMDPSLSNYHLTLLSPCINQGDNSAPSAGSVDLDGDPRIYEGTVDIGADEVVPRPRIVRVQPAGNDVNDGSTWALAKRTAQAGVEAAAYGGEVWVAAGTYPGVSTWLGGASPLDTSISIYGGFAGNETDASQRVQDPTLTTLGDAYVAWRTTLTVADATLGSVLLDFVGHAHLSNCIVSSVHVPEDASLAASGTQFLAGVRAEFGELIAIADSTFAGSGDAVVAAVTPVYLTRCRFQNGGTGVDLSALLPSQISGCLFTNGGISVLAAPASVQIANCTVAGTAGGFSLGGYESATIVNTIVADSGFVVNASGSAGAEMKSSAFWNNGPAPFRGLADPTGSGGNISANPLFVNGPGRNYRLALGSPCIDSGDDATVPAGATDLDGKPRKVGSRVDMGAYEYQWRVFRMVDATLALRIAAGLSVATADQVAELSVDGDARISAGDAVRIARKAAGREPNP